MCAIVPETLVLEGTRTQFIRLHRGPGGNRTRVHYESLCLWAPNHVIVLTTSRWVSDPGFSGPQTIVSEEISECEWIRMGFSLRLQESLFKNKRERWLTGKRKAWENSIGFHSNKSKVRIPSWKSLSSCVPSLSPSLDYHRCWGANPFFAAFPAVECTPEKQNSAALTGTWRGTSFPCVSHPRPCFSDSNE